MRIKHAVFVGSIVALAAAAMPAAARNSDTQKSSEAATSSSCHSYQQAPDGSWKELPCRELDVAKPPQTQSRSPARSADDNTR
jgi:hypothetical protein